MNNTMKRTVFVNHVLKVGISKKDEMVTFCGITHTVTAWYDAQTHQIDLYNTLGERDARDVNAVISCPTCSEVAVLNALSQSLL